MGSVADCYDYSMAEAFFATLETVLDPAAPPVPTHREAKLATSTTTRCCHNRQRRHTSIGAIPPVAYEARHAMTAAAA